MNENDRKGSKTPALVRHAVVTASVFASCATYAQSSVTLYGIADAGFEHVNNSTGGALNREVSGNLSGSRWGFKGVEDLGGALKANFVLENGFNINDGTSAQSTRGLGTNPTTTSREFGRQAWMGLSYKDQQLSLGRQNTLLYDQAVLFDPMSASTRYSAFSLDSAMATRADNSVKYTGAFGALIAQGMYSTRYDTGYGSEVAGAELTGRYFGGSLMYAAAPFALSVSYEQRNSNTVATNTGTERRATAAATYVIGPVKAFAGYRYLRDSSGFLPASPILTANGSNLSAANLFWAGARYSATPALILTASAYYQDVHSTSADPWMAVLCADYFLSKRTDLYAEAAFARNKGGSALGVNGYGSVVAGHNQTGMLIGMRQKF